MRKKILSVFAALLTLFAAFGGPTSVTNMAAAARPAGHRFCEKGMPFTVFQQRVKDSLAADPTGNKALVGCRGTPNFYLTGYQKHFKQHGINITLNTAADLPAALARFHKIQVDPGMNYVTDCLWDTPHGLAVRVDCETRMVEPGEDVYGLTSEDGEEVALYFEHCANSASGSIVVMARACPQVIAPSMGVHVPLRFRHLDNKPVPGRCTGLLMAGEQTMRTDMPEGCQYHYTLNLGPRIVRVDCSWDGPARDASALLGHVVGPQNYGGSFYTLADGTNTWLLPEDSLDGEFAVCYDLPAGTQLLDGTRLQQSLFVTVAVRRHDFIKQGNRLVATITVEHVLRAAEMTLRGEVGRPIR